MPINQYVYNLDICAIFQCLLANQEAAEKEAAKVAEKEAAKAAKAAEKEAAKAAKAAEKEAAKAAKAAEMAVITEKEVERVTVTTRKVQNNITTFATRRYQKKPEKKQKEIVDIHMPIHYVDGKPTVTINDLLNLPTTYVF